MSAGTQKTADKQKRSGRGKGVLRSLAYVSGALVLAGGWAFFYIQSQGVDLHAGDEALATVNELRTIDQRWNDRLIRARYGRETGPASTPAGAASPGAASAPSAPSQSIHVRLQLQVFQFTSLVPGRELAELKRAFEEKADLVARYMATLDNSGKVTRDTSSEAQAGALLPRTAGPPGIESDRNASPESLFELALFASTGPRLDLVTRSLQRAMSEAIDTIELFRVYLLYYSGFLVVVLGNLALGLASSRRQVDLVNRQLHEVNESLEERVVARTRELSQAMTRLKESEALLVQSEKMSSLGQMVAGIAHEVNTPLAYVKASLEVVGARIAANARLATETEALLGLLSDESPDESRLESQFSAVRDLIGDLRDRRADENLGTAVKDGLYGIGQISEIISNLKDFSRLDRSKVADYDLHVGLESTLRIARNLLGNRQVRKEYGSIPHISCSPSEINQVFLNLIGNAAQAVSEKDGMIILCSGMSGKDQVWVDVIDNGHGIPPEVLPKIFDPFFTTKEVGKGTGLGLSICYRIVESHGGRLEVESVVGVGTRFRMNLPVTQPASIPTALSKAVVSAPSGPPAGSRPAVAKA